MKVLELLDEIEEIVDTASSLPLTGKIMVDSDELLEIVKEIRLELPDEIQQAKWIKDERQRIIDEAKMEYEKLLQDAKDQAETLIDNDDITVKAKMKAAEIMRVTEQNVKELKMGTFDYIDSILYDFQQKMDSLNGEYFARMFEDMQNTFNGINDTLAKNREEIGEMAFRTRNED